LTLPYYDMLQSFYMQKAEEMRNGDQQKVFEVSFN
jgi:hypothetical protein